MAVYNLSAATLPANTGYPGNVQDLLKLIESYVSVTSDPTLSTFVISNATPSAEDNDKVWFQTQPGVSGAPQSIDSLLMDLGKNLHLFLLAILF
jgi:hypothetical protein